MAKYTEQHSTTEAYNASLETSEAASTNTNDTVQEPNDIDEQQMQRLLEVDILHKAASKLELNKRKTDVKLAEPATWTTQEFTDTNAEQFISSNPIEQARKNIREESQLSIQLFELARLLHEGKAIISATTNHGEKPFASLTGSDVVTKLHIRRLDEHDSKLTVWSEDALLREINNMLLNGKQPWNLEDIHTFQSKHGELPITTEVHPTNQ